MPHCHRHRSFPYPATTLFALASDIERYPDFLPGIRKITPHRENQESQDFMATVEVAALGFQESYQCRIQLIPSKKILVESTTPMTGPLRHLKNYWHFHERGTSTTEVEFFIDFDLKNPILNQLVGGVWEKTVDQFMDLFQKRAEALYS